MEGKTPELKGWQMWLFRVSRVIALVEIVLAGAIAMLYFIDNATNGDMAFMVSPISKGLVLALCVIAIINGILHMMAVDRIKALTFIKKMRERKAERIK